MKTSENGIAFIKKNEGFVSIPKMDNGKLAWGYGHDQRAGEPVPSNITPEQADTLLRTDLPGYEAHVNALAPNATQNQFDALVDFCYNLGPGDLATMLHHGLDKAAGNIPAWHWEHINGVLTDNKGLAARRAEEVSLFNS